MAWVGAVVQAGMGLFQTMQASKAARELPDSRKYTASPQMKRAEEMAERRAKEGFSAAERAAFGQGMARRTAASERVMRNVGLGGAAQAVSNIFNIDAMNQFAAQSEAERRRGEAMYAGIAGQMQSIQDRETASFNQMLQQQRTALGQAAASGMKNITGSIGTAIQSENTNKLAEAYMNSGSGFGRYADPYSIPDSDWAFTADKTAAATTTPTTTGPANPSVVNTAQPSARVSPFPTSAVPALQPNPSGVAYADYLTSSSQPVFKDPYVDFMNYNPDGTYQAGIDLSGYNRSDYFPK